jgi:small-conductance mechanosensitive channel
MLDSLSNLADWARWSIILLIGFPLATIVLAELHATLRRKNSPFARPVQGLRIFVLPSVVAWLVAEQVLQLPHTNLALRITNTLIGIIGIANALAFLNTLFFDVARPDSWQRRVPRLLRDLAQTILVAIGAAIVLSKVWDADLGGLLTALGVGSLVLGLALQDTLGNVFSGIAMLIERPFNIGDWIKTGDTTGRVIEINWRAVHLETGARELLVIPNGVIAKNQLVNFNRPTPIHREKLEIGFSYDDPPNKVKQLMMAMILEVDGVLPEPPPAIVTMDYKESSILYAISFTVSDYGLAGRIRGEVMTRIWYTAQRHNLTIPFPIQMAYSMEPPPAPTRETPTKRAGRAIGALPNAGALSADMLTELSLLTPLRAYARNEKLLDFEHSIPGLFLILSGKVKVNIRDNAGEEVEVERLGQGEFFGERSLIAGVNSHIQVIALEDTEIVLVAPATLDRIFSLAPRVAKNISDTMERRRKAHNT